MYFTIRRNASGHYWWRAVSDGNNEILAASEMLTSKRACEHAISIVKSEAAAGHYLRQDGRGLVPLEEEEMARKPAIHTVPDGNGGWINRTEGSGRGFGPAERKGDAERIGRDSARGRQTEHISHRRDGTIGERRSYGNDPYPPKG